MRRIFGARKAQAPAPSLGDASQRLDERTTALDDKIRKLEVELGGYKEKLKKARGAAAQTLKRRAMGVLKRKRMYDQQRDQLAGQAFNVEQTSFAIDSVKDTLETVQAMKTASKTLKKEVKKVDLSQIEDLQDDLADMMEVITAQNLTSRRLHRSAGANVVCRAVIGRGATNTAAARTPSTPSREETPAAAATFTVY